MNSLAAGVTPRLGIEAMLVGRVPETQALLRDLDVVRDGGATFRLVCGPYGSGKSFLLGLARHRALGAGLVVADADLSPERRLVGTQHQGLATYAELMRNLSTRARPDGGALGAMLEKWIETLRAEAMRVHGLTPLSPELGVHVERMIVEATGRLQHLVHAFEFATVISQYWRGMQGGDDALQEAALKWLRGEYTTRTEANAALGVRVIIDDATWYDYVKLMAEFVVVMGYGGLCVVIDEAVNLYKISNVPARSANYEKVLTILNDTLQGKAAHLQVLIGVTPKMLEDPRRGLFSYEALRSRLEGSRVVSGLVDYHGPVLRLPRLSDTELLGLLARVRDLHAAHHGREVGVGDAQLVTLMEAIMNRVGAEELVTPREFVRELVMILNALLDAPDLDFGALVARSALPAAVDTDDAAPAADDLATFEL